MQSPTTFMLWETALVKLVIEMNSFKLFLLCVSMMSPFFSICAETVTKVITDEKGVGLPYSVVMIQNKRGGVMSDEDGKVEMTLKSTSETDTILVMYTGFETMKIPVVDFVSMSTDTLSLVPSSRKLPEVVALPKKLKIKTVGKQYHSGMMKVCYGGESPVKGDAFGYEYHAKGDKRYALYKIGFYYNDDRPNHMTEMKFMVNVYDMSNVKGEPTQDFVCVLREPLFIDYKYNPVDKGKFVFTIPENIVQIGRAHV